MRYFGAVLIVFFMSSPVWAQQDLAFQAGCSPSDDRATLSFVGDFIVHKEIYLSVVNGNKRFVSAWKNAIPYFSKVDFSVGNLEGPAALGIDSRGRDHGDIGFVYDGNVYSGTNFLFNYHPQILPELLQSGIDLITMANNHSLDRGSLGIDRTLQAAQHYGIPTVGTRLSNQKTTDFHKIVKVKTMNVAFIGCTEFTNGFKDKFEQVLFCYKDADKISALIRNLAKDSTIDAIVVFPHWGDEYEPKPDGDQKIYARKFLEAGATIVAGSHPHVLQPWEKYITKDGRETLIAYSLGNFVSGQSGLEPKTGAIIYVGLSKSGNQKAQISGVGYTPTFRVGTEVVPMESNGDPLVLAHAAKSFGSLNRVELKTDLNEKLCH